MDYRNIDKRFGRRDRMLVVFAEPPRASEPSEGTFHDPASRWNFEAMERRLVFDDLRAGATRRAHTTHPLDQRASVPAVGPDAAQPPEASAQRRKQQASPIAILHVRRVDADQENQSRRIDQKMSLSSHHLLASIISTNSALLSCSHTLRVKDRSRGGFFLPALRRTASRSV
jgi:hypothetical protein